MTGEGSLVVLDAAVLYPVTLCDTLLRLAEAELHQPRWSQDFLNELIRNLGERIGAERAERRVGFMRSVCWRVRRPRCLVRFSS